MRINDGRVSKTWACASTGRRVRMKNKVVVVIDSSTHYLLFELIDLPLAVPIIVILIFIIELVLTD